MSSRLVFLEGDDRLAAMEAAWREWYHPHRDREAHVDFLRQLMATDWGQTAWRVPAVRDERGEVAASLFLYRLAFRLDHRRLVLGGLGSIVVRPALRRMGLGRFFLRSVEELLRSEGHDGVVLFSDIGPAYYERLGYAELPQGALLADLREFRDAGPDEPTSSRVRPYERGDFDDVRNLYNTSSSLQRFALLRDDGYWEEELLRAKLAEEMFSKRPHPWGFLVGEREGRVVSYLRTAREPKRRSLVVLECGFEAGARGDVTAMLRFLLEHLGPDAPRVLDSVVPTRLANLCPANRFAWKRETRDRLMMKSFGSFAVPADLYQDERLVWPCDWF